MTRADRQAGRDMRLPGRTMAQRTEATHYVNEDWRPLCGAPPGNAWLWAFDDERITCVACRRLLHEDRDPK